MKVEGGVDMRIQRSFVTAPLRISRTCAMLLFAIAVAGGGEAKAQWSWEVSLGAGAEYNDNIDLLPSESVVEEAAAEEGLGGGELELSEEIIPVLPRDEWIYIVAPGLSLAWEERDDYFHVDYRGEYRDYRESVRGEGWYHYLDAALDWRRLEPFRLAVSDVFDYSPRFITRPEADIRNQVEHNVLTIRPSVFWNVNRTTTFELAYIHERDVYFGEDVILAEEEAAGSGPVLLENDEIFRHLGRLELGRRWSPRWESFLFVEGGVVERSLSDDYDILWGGIGGLHRPSATVDLEYEIGAEQRWYQEEETGDAGLEAFPDATPLVLTGSLALEWRHHEKGTFDLSFERGNDDRFDGETILTSRVAAVELWRLTGRSTVAAGILYEWLDYRVAPRNDTIWSPYLLVSWAMTEWLALELEGEWRRSRIEDDLALAAGGMDTVEDDLFHAGAGLVIGLGSYFEFEVAYDYLDNSSDAELRAYRQNVFSLMLTGRM